MNKKTILEKKNGRLFFLMFSGEVENKSKQEWLTIEIINELQFYLIWYILSMIRKENSF